MNHIHDIFVQYGWAGINATIIILVLFYGGKYIIKKMTNNVRTGLEEVGKNLTTEIANQNKNLVETIVGQQHMMLEHIISGKKDAEKNHNDMLGARMELTEEIRNALKDIGQIHGCQRVFIIEFHNSYQNLSGTPFAKFSCTYEWFDKGIESVQFEIKDLQFSALSGAVSRLYKSNKQQIVYENIADFTKDCPALIRLFRDYPAESLVCTAMYDRDNIMIGALVLEYVYEKPKNINLNQLHIQAAELTSLINLRYKYLRQ